MNIRLKAKGLVRKIRFYFYCKRNFIRIARGSKIVGEVKIGKYTRINEKSHLGPCEIGSFCAIGGRLVVRSTDHYLNYLNIQDYFQRNILKSNISVVGKSKGTTVIGNGVWIGDSVVILGGVHVGNGAVIGAGSVVTKSVPAFAIAVGNPAKVIKYRFEKNKIEFLEKIEWWSWPLDKQLRNKELFELDIDTMDLSSLRQVFADYQ